MLLQKRQDFRRAGAVGGALAALVGGAVALRSNPLAGMSAAFLVAVVIFLPLEYLRGKRAAVIPHLGPLDAGIVGATMRAIMISSIVFVVTSAMVIAKSYPPR